MTEKTLIPLKTKIIATIGPASDNSHIIYQLIDSGAAAFRLNTSHGTIKSHARTMRRIRRVESARMIRFSNKMNENEKIWAKYPIIVDLQGPKIRVGPSLPNPLLLCPNHDNNGGVSEAILKPGEWCASDASNTIPVDYKGLIQDVSIGSKIFLADGRIELEVIDILPHLVKTRVICGGLLEKRKGINIPGSTRSIEILTERDKQFINFALEQSADYIALSFVRNAIDVQKVKDYMQAQGGLTIPIIAKIEKPEALINIREITIAADAVMIARGDLGIETPVTELPIWQPKIIKIAQQCHKPVIVATQMLLSMVTDKLPKRSEVTDVATAAKEGADAVMLSEETAIGKYPLLAVKTMRDILRSVENLENDDLVITHDFPPKQWLEHVTDFIPAILTDPTTNNLDGVVAISKSTGETILKVATTRKSPVIKKAPFISISSNPDIARKVALYYATQAYEINFDMDNQYKTLLAIDRILRRHLLFKKDDKIIIFSNTDSSYDELRLVLWKIGNGAMGNKLNK